ncbi:MAG: hypothetical protein O7C63_00425 [Alphaproteobacteria bacterium]|nr:hypothetical protein [Alphaproteobacteria bacterium]
MSFKTGLIAAALVMAAAPVAVAQNCAEDLLAKGEQLHGQGRTILTVKVYTQALETCEMSDELAAHIYTRRGIANYAQSHLAEAAADYTASMNISGKRPTIILMKRASALAGSGNDELALRDLNEAIGQEPDKGPLYLMRMSTNQRLGNDAAVEADFALIQTLDDMSTQWAAYKFMGVDPEALTQ